MGLQCHVCHIVRLVSGRSGYSRWRTVLGCVRRGAVADTGVDQHGRPGGPGELDRRAVTDERDAVGVGVGLPQRVPDADPPLDPLPVAQPLLQLAIDVTVI